MSNRTLGLCGALFLAVLVGCSSASSAPQPTKILSSSSAGGQRYPYGSSGSVGDLSISKVASDPQYAYTPQKAVTVAGLAEQGPLAERMFLSALRGPNGEELQFTRQGSCCPFKTSGSDLGEGLLDVYEVTYLGLEEPLVLYLNMYDKGEVLVPVGLTGAK
jgi:hypothetical protein